MTKYILKQKGDGMKLEELLKEEGEMSGVDTVGVITLIYPSKLTQWGKQQFMLIEDNGSIVAVQAKDTDFTEADKGCSISIKDATWKTYEKGGETKHVLDIPKDSIKVVSEAKKFDDSKAKKDIHKSYYESLMTALELLGDDEICGLLETCKKKGWNSDNITAVAASLYIELNKQKHKRNF